MDSALEQRWRLAMRPFDGQCLVVDQIELSQLRTTMREVVRSLHLAYSVIPLFRFDDWHEHDGFVTQRIATNWTWLEQVLADDESLYTARQGDTAVHWAVYPADFSFLLRWYILDDDDELLPGRYGRFDLCVSSECIKISSSGIPDVIAKHVEVRNAKQYFDRMYAG